MDSYIQKSSLRWSHLKTRKNNEPEMVMTLVMLYYFVIHEYKIILLSQDKNKAIISELIIGIMRAIMPLTYVYPIVAATITNHHF
jgi:hypothetical protein